METRGRLSNLPKFAQGDPSRVWRLGVLAPSPEPNLLYHHPTVALGRVFLPFLFESFCSGVWGEENSEGPQKVCVGGEGGGRFVRWG